MPRELCFGNGDLMVTLDRGLAIRDLYFPYAGMENHVGGHRCRIGVWVDGRFAWIDDGWARTIGYRPESLVSNAVLTHPELPVELTVATRSTLSTRSFSGRSRRGARTVGCTNSVSSSPTTSTSTSRLTGSRPSTTRTRTR